MTIKKSNNLLKRIQVAIKLYDDRRDNILKRLREQLEKDERWLKDNSANSFVRDTEWLMRKVKVETLQWAIMVVHEG